MREYTPAWLELKPELRGHADALRALAPITRTEDLVAAQPQLDAARSAAAAARDAAWDAAWDAAYKVSYAAAFAIFKPVVERLQVSAMQLFDRMIDVVKDAAA